jgi:hypothetical protein
VYAEVLLDRLKLGLLKLTHIHLFILSFIHTVGLRHEVLLVINAIQSMQDTELLKFPGANCLLPLRHKLLQLIRMELENLHQYIHCQEDSGIEDNNTKDIWLYCNRSKGFAVASDPTNIHAYFRTLL